MSSSPFKHESVPTAAIIVIGDEILSGRTKDKNIGWLADQLSALGIQLVEARIIADKKQTIINTVQTLSGAYDLVFTSGGIGPTHDDITAASVSKAFNIEYGYHKEAFSILENHEPQAAYISTFEETKGDLFIQIEDLTSAREAYQKAITNKRDDQSLALLELKLADIPLKNEFVDDSGQANKEPEGEQ